GHWQTPSSALARPKPYQGVRVRDPVKELLRRKRSLEPKTAPPTADAVAQNNLSSYTQGNSTELPHTLLKLKLSVNLCSAGWKAAAPIGGGVLQPAAAPWSMPDYNQQDRSAPTLAYSATPGLTADVYMQTLCPSYTMLTYTHTPLLTNFGTIPMASAPASLPQMELPDAGLTYLPWAQPLTTISTMPNPAMQFSTNSAALPGGSPLVHMPLSMSLTTMMPQLDPQCVVEPESPSLLDKLLEDQKDDGGEGDKDSYGSSLFIHDV
uniref:OCA domain-containing protein n=1 Tax=Mola mola TaxID=94237 RepID=A0A3Q4BUM8_MOLML